MGFSALLVWAALDSSVLDGGSRVAAEPWGMVTFADLGLGLVFAAVWIAVREGVGRAWGWWIGLVLLGNGALLIYLLVKARGAESWRDWLLTPRAT